MKATKITYYVTTGIISVMMAYIAFETLTKPEVKVSMAHLGFPDYFRIELGISKIIGVILLWLPIRLLKETAYIGFAIMFLSASIAHSAVGDPADKVIAGIVFLVILAASYVSRIKLQNK
ncbi:DoxX family protein [Mucilaginibacter gilvus]|uniref:DoxX family protein n=1 Tax=Mucilaginibacter gilvus TaxID=2305909 RepID=A0A3S3YW07_9SPHI|nr:DoxX family protein [Mucilaginibacter gilvus]RWY51615.1 DoxX family protein [Mucilaginibacter gilvus]